MLKNIALPFGQKTVTFREIPALFATAIHPEAPNPTMNQRISWHVTVDEYTNEVRNAVHRGWLEPRSPLTLLPVPQAIGEQLLNAFVTVENLKEYAARFQIGVQEAVPLEQADPAAGKVEAVKGITKQQVINAFEGIHFDRDHWGKNLATPPNWLEYCRVARGNKKTSATWNPVLIAIALTDPKRGISVKRLDAVFVDLKDWAVAWREASDYLR